MKLSLEDYNKINEYENEFSHALNEGYFRIVNRNLLVEYAAIYKRVFNRDSKILNGCSRCVLQDIKLLAKTYFDDKKEYEAQNKAVEELSDENDTETTKMSKYTYGDKKKATTKKNNKK